MYDALTLKTQDNIFYLAPQYEDLRPSLKAHCLDKKINSHVFFFSSGTTSANLKGYLISKEAMFANAQAVNVHLGLTSEDRWGVTLPPYHVGGISMYFRSVLLNQKAPVNLLPWKPQDLGSLIELHHISIISLVPSQIYDLVKLQLRCPAMLKCVLAGGDFLSESLEREALKLGWPIIRTFGMSELGSQLATGTLKDGSTLKILGIHEVKIDRQGRILVKSPSLYSYVMNYVTSWEMQSADELKDPDGFYPLPDTAKLSEGHLTPMGREDGQVKISGRLLDFFKLKNRLEEFCLERDALRKMELYLKKDERSGSTLGLLVEESVGQQLIDDFQVIIKPWKIDSIKKVPLINRTELGKLIVSSSE